VTCSGNNEQDDEASQDHYLALMVDKVVKTGKTIKTENQPWAVR